MAEVTTSDTAEAAEIEDAAEADPLQPYADLIEKTRQPISADSPCGEDVRYDDDYQELKTEIDRLGSVATDIDYDRIVELGHMILSSKSKDLTTAGFLALGLVRTKGVVGIAEAAVILDTLVETFWEHIHPVKPVRRRNAIQFVADHLKSWLEQRLEKQRPTEQERAPLEVAHAQLKELQAFTMKELEALAPALSGVTKALEETIRRLPKPQPKPEPKKAAPPSDTSAAPAQQAATTSAASSSSTTTSAASQAASIPSDLTTDNEARQAIFKVAAFLREKDRKHPLAYRLLRAQRWGRLVQEPPNDGGKTKIPAPPAARLTYFNGLLEQGEFEKLLEEAENDFQSQPIYLWLGLQRLMAAAAEALGMPYTPVAEAVMIETALLVRRVPGLVNLTFNDGTSFADPMTQEWLASSVGGLLGSGGGGGGGTPTASSGSSHIDAKYAEARKKLGGGDLAGALSVMQQDSGQDASEEDRFRRRLYVAVLCVRGNQPNMARAMLESLDEAVGRYGLDTWNPALTLEVWSNLYTCYTTLTKTAKPADKASFAERAAEVLDKISRLDAGYALTVLGQK